MLYVAIKTTCTYTGSCFHLSVFVAAIMLALVVLARGVLR
jgi:hypothetical protein